MRNKTKTIVVWFILMMVIFLSRSYIQISSIGHEQLLESALSEIEIVKKINADLQSTNDILRESALADGVHSEKMSTRLKLIVRENEELQMTIDYLKKRYSEYRAFEENRVNNLQRHLETCISDNVTKKQEMLVKKSKNNLVEFSYAFESQLEKIRKNLTLLEQNAEKFKTNFKTQLRAAIIDAEDLQAINDGWRKREAKELHEMIQSKIRNLQNPSDCTNSKKLICDINLHCGFGCQMHHMLYCALFAYGLQRTLILESSGWSYNKDGWETIFLPVSETCTKVTGRIYPFPINDELEDIQNVYIAVGNGLKDVLPYRPLGFPKDIGDRLLRLHGNPSVWWTGQFIHYLMRPQPWLIENIVNNQKAIGFQTPCVGIHVRRSDKVGKEASYHSLEEYMKHVIDWYDKLDLRLSREKPAEKSIRRIYLASDDASVLPQARKKYPNYMFYGNKRIAESAAVKNRYSTDSLVGLLTDIYTLAECDFIVCTMSSQVCRIAYELMQIRHPDASDRIHSLDDVYWMAGMYDHEQQVIYPHQGDEKELNLEVGDVIRLAGNHWDGYSKGTNLRTNLVGLYPSFKVVEKYRLIGYPTYEKKNLEQSDNNFTIS